MKKYEVTLYYHTDVIVEVKAKDEEEALQKAYIEVGKKKYDAQILHNVTEDADPDVEEVEEGWRTKKDIVCPISITWQMFNQLISNKQ